jgi:hypothetical protein
MLFSLLAAFSGGLSAQAPPPAAVKPPPTQAELDKQFQEQMSGVVLIGHYTAGGNEAQPKEERYTISSVKKMQGDEWLFVTRVQYGTKDVPVPIIIPVKWAGDTPVISLTDATIPGLGTYTARVMIFRDQYVGFWSAKDHGGNLWGRIEKLKSDGAGAPAATPQPKAGN